MRRNLRKNILNLKRKNTISHNLGEKARQIENRRGLRWSSCPPFHFWAGCFSMSALLFSWGPGQSLCGNYNSKVISNYFVLIHVLILTISLYLCYLVSAP